MKHTLEVPSSTPIYRRVDNGINAEIAFLSFDLEQHAELYNTWQNTPRVAQFWQEQGSLEKHKAQLKQLLTNASVQPIIATIDNEPFAYFEVYEAEKDRIAPFYDVQPHDKGIHMLVGSEKHRGPHKVNAWLVALCDFIFTQNTQTHRIVSEPRHDNHKMIFYLKTHGFKKLKEFDFPHKRAALMLLERQNFALDN